MHPRPPPPRGPLSLSLSLSGRSLLLRFRFAATCLPRFSRITGVLPPSRTPRDRNAITLSRIPPRLTTTTAAIPALARRFHPVDLSSPAALPPRPPYRDGLTPTTNSRSEIYFITIGESESNSPARVHNNNNNNNNNGGGGSGDNDSRLDRRDGILSFSLGGLATLHGAPLAFSVPLCLSHSMSLKATDQESSFRFLSFLPSFLFRTASLPLFFHSLHSLSTPLRHSPPAPDTRA